MGSVMEMPCGDIYVKCELNPDYVAIAEARLHRKNTP